MPYYLNIDTQSNVSDKDRPSSSCKVLDIMMTSLFCVHINQPLETRKGEG